MARPGTWSQAEAESSQEATLKRLRAVEAEAGEESSLHAECMAFAESTEGGAHLILSMSLYSEQWSRPPTEDIRARDVDMAVDYAMHHKTLAEQAISHAYGLAGDTERRDSHARRAQIAFPRVYWPSDAFLHYAGEELAKARKS